MSESDFMREQYLALRREILARQRRAYGVVLLGLIGVPFLTYIGSSGAELMWTVLPLLVLLVILLYLSEQNAMMRAGRYIREQIEPSMNAKPGWEAWLESRSEQRLMEKHFFACFILIFFGFFFMSIAIALTRMWREAADDPSGQYTTLFWGGVFAYAIGSVWAISTLLHHWRSSVGTADSEG